MTVTSATSTSTALPYSSTGTATAGTATGGTTGTTGTSSSATSVTSALLSEQARIVATLGGTRSTVQTYDMTGLLTQVQQADMAAVSAAAQASATGTATTATAAAAASDDAGVTTTGTDLNANWASILASTPALAPVALGYAADQSILNTISVYA